MWKVSRISLSVAAFGALLAVGGLIHAGSAARVAAVADEGPAGPEYPELWTTRADTNVLRNTHVAQPLPDGTVLVAAGIGGESAEIYNLATDEWVNTSPMNVFRNYAVSVPLANGDVLVIGGTTRCDLPPESCPPNSGGVYDLANAEYYDYLDDDGFPGVWRATDPAHDMSIARSRYHAAARLGDGRVVVIGGIHGYSEQVANVDIYDPSTNAWTRGPDLPAPRLVASATSLNDGRVLVAGGARFGAHVDNDYLIFDGSTWTEPKLLPGDRARHQAVRLTSGQVLLTGGFAGVSNLPVATTFLYDPESDAWTVIGPMHHARADHVMVALDDGTALVTAGCATAANGCIGAPGDIEPTTERWSLADGWTIEENMITPRLTSTLTALPGAAALSVGGIDAVNHYSYSTELYDVPCAPPAPGLVAWWPGEGNAEDAGPSSAAGIFDGTTHGGLGYATGKVGQAFNFDGVNDSISIEQTNGLQMNAGDFTVSAWVRFTDSLDYAIVYDNYGGPPDMRLHIENNRAGLYFRDNSGTGGGNPVVVTGTSALNDGAWHHVAGVRTGTSGYLYVDGCLEGTAADPDVGSVGHAWPYAHIGATRTDGALGNPEAIETSFKGQIDEVQLYNRSLSPAEIADQSACGSVDCASPPEAPTISGDPSLASGRIIALPALNYFGLDWVCRSWVRVQNGGDVATRAIMVAWGEAEPCATAAGPLGVACSGLIAPGGAWSFDDNALPGGKRSGLVYSVADGSYGGDNIGDTLCATLSTNVTTAAEFRAFHAAYVGGGTVAGIPMAVARGEPLAVVAYRSCPADITPGRDATSAYEGISENMLATPFASGQADYRYLVPLAMAESAGMNTQLYVQNTGLDCASVTLRFRPQDSCLPAAACAMGALSVPAGQVMSFEPLDCVGSDWAGSVEVQSDMPLAIAADLYGRDSLSTYRGVSRVPSPGAEELVGPLYHSPETGWDSLVEVHNLGQASAAVQVTFQRSDGTVEATVSDTLCAGAGKTFPLPVSFDAPTIQTGWIRVESLTDLGGDQQPLAAMARLIKYSDAQRTEVREASAYNLLPLRELTGEPVDLPFVFNDLSDAGLTSEVQLAAGPQFGAGSSGTENVQHTYRAAAGIVAQNALPLTQGQSIYQDIGLHSDIPENLHGSLVLASASRRARFSAAGIVRSSTRIGEDIPGDEAAVYVGIPRLAPPCAPLPNGLAGWWPLDEAAGIVAPDLSVHGNHGTLVGTSTVWHPTGGRVRGSLEFPRAEGYYASVPDAPELDVDAGDFSIDTWAFIPAGADTITGSRVIAEKRMTTLHQGYRFYIRGNLNPFIYASRLELALTWDPAPGHNYFFTGPIIGTSVANGMWHHFAVTVERVGTTKAVKIYVDGIPQTMAASDGLLGLDGPINLANNGPFSIGGNSGSAGGFGGDLDEVHLYKVALTTAQVQAIFNAGASGHCLPEATPTPSHTPTPTATNTPSPTTTPSPSPTATQTPTFTPTSTNTPTPTFTPNPLCAPLPANLVAWWSLDETGGTLARDRSSNHNDGTVNGSLGWDADGKVGRSFRFADVSARLISVPDADSLDVGTGNFSLDAWVKLPAPPVGSVNTIVDKRTVVKGNVAYGYAFFLNGTGLALQIADGKAGTYYSAFGVPADNTWHHVGVTVERASNKGIRFYLDGMVSSLTFNPQSRSGSLDSAAPLIIGRHATTGGYFDGLIDELQLYRRVLSPAEMAAIFNADSNGSCLPPSGPTITPSPTPSATATAQAVCVPAPANLVAWWPLNEASGQVVHDLTTAHNDGLLSGGNPSWGPGKVGNALRFYEPGGTLPLGATVPDAAALDVGTGDFSWAVWAKLVHPLTNNLVIGKPDQVMYAFSLVGASNLLEVFLRDKANTPGKFFQSTSIVPPDLQWHHLAVSIMRSSVTGGRFYIDGAPAGTFNPLPYQGSLDNPLALHFGHEDAWLDEIQLYQRALTQVEMSSLFNAGAAGVCPPPP